MTQALTAGIELTDPQFSSISRLVKGMAGINLHDGKRMLVKARLNKRLRALGMRSFDQYVDRLRADVDGSETRAMLDALSPNLTFFFREPRHFQLLAEHVVPAMLERHRTDRRLRLWSAGCSSGEEPYSIAMTLRKAIPDAAFWDIGILATDISTRVLQVAARGVYGSERLRKVHSEHVRENFHGEDTGGYRVKESLRRMVTFARLNLMDAWPMRGKFDTIFCRNVMIYFDKPTQEALVDRFWNQLAPGGVLFVGHSESLAGIRHRFEHVQPTMYQRR